MGRLPSVQTRRAEYLVLRLSAPGGPAVNAGILLYDASADRLEFKLREDIAGLGTALDPEEREALAGLPGQISTDIRNEGAAGYLQRLEDTVSNLLQVSERRPAALGDFQYQLSRLFDEHVLGIVREPARVLPFERHLPVYSLRAAAGKFGEDMEVEPEGWVEAPEGMRLHPDMFVAHITGHSMEPEVPDGSLAVFRAQPAGSRVGLRVLVWRPGAAGNEFTLKVYRSEKVYQGEAWEHKKITLEPLNPEYDDLELNAETQYQVLGQFLRVLPGDACIQDIESAANERE